MANDGDESASSTTDQSSEYGVSKRLAVVIALMSIGVMAAVFQVNLTLQTLFDMRLMTVIESIAPLLLVVPILAGFIASQSLHGFRKEVLATMVVLPFALLGPQFAAFALGTVLGAIMVSFKAKNIYNERNRNWVQFKAAGSMVTVLALTIGVTAALFFGAAPDFREDIRGNLTQHSVDTALEYADVAGLPTTGGMDASFEGEQSAMIGELAGTLVENVSETTVTATESIVFTAVEETRQVDPTRFDSQEQSVLRGAFDQAQENVPDTLRQQTQDRLDQQYGGEQTTVSDAESGVMTEGLREIVTPRVRNFVDQFITNTQEVKIAVFIAAFSLVMLFKLPFEFLAALYAAVLSRLPLA